MTSHRCLRPTPSARTLTGRLQCAAIAALLACGAALSWAQELPQAEDLNGLEQMGYLPLNTLNTPLLHRLGGSDTGDDRVLLRGGLNDLPPHLRQTGQELSSNNEFVAHAALQKLQPYLAERAQLMSQAQGWRAHVEVKLSPYDFNRHRFTMTLSLNTQVKGSARDLHCLGTYANDAKGDATLCVEPTNWDRGSLAFEYLVMDRDDQAEAVRDDIQNHRIQFLFLLKKDGPLRVNRNSKLHLGLFGHPVNEIQPARVLALAAFDARSGRILSITPMP